MPIQALLSRARSLLAALFGQALRQPRAAGWSQSRAPLIDDDRVMQSHTHAWLRGIPNGAHPKQLCRHYPRIANRIAVNWEHLPVIDRLLTDLMVDRRGERKGFPPRVRQEIERLYSLHARRMTPLLRRGGFGPEVAQRSMMDPQRRARLRAPVAVSSIKR